MKSDELIICSGDDTTGGTANSDGLFVLKNTEVFPNPTNPGSESRFGGDGEILLEEGTTIHN